MATGRQDHVLKACRQGLLLVDAVADSPGTVISAKWELAPNAVFLADVFLS
jgi:hypothetical protein